jgi:3-oxoacyl-[acyl-carrier-protein] synthase-3
MTRTLAAERTKPLTLMLLGYGVGLSWGAAVIEVDERVPLLHGDYSGTLDRRGVSKGSAG